jgi:hypothetical protein
MVDQFRPEAKPVIAKLAAVLLTLLAELPMLVTVLVAIFFLCFGSFGWGL